MLSNQGIFDGDLDGSSEEESDEFVMRYRTKKRPPSHSHISKKSSFTLDGNRPFDFGLFEGERTNKKRMPNVVTMMKAHKHLHIANAASFTLDMFDENDPFDSWDDHDDDDDEDDDDGMHGVTMTMTMDMALDMHSGDELEDKERESVGFNLRRLTSESSTNSMKRMVSL